MLRLWLQGHHSMVVPTSVAVKTLFSSLVTPSAAPRAVTDGEVIVMDAFLRPRFFLGRVAVLAPSNKIKQ
jgi:hypothetical protein